MMSNLPQRTVLGQIGKEKRFLLKVNLFIAYILKDEGQPNVNQVLMQAFYGPKLRLHNYS